MKALNTLLFGTALLTRMAVAQSLSAADRSREALNPETTTQVCHHALDSHTLIDASATNQTGDLEAAFVARWLDPRPTSSIIHSTVFTRGHCVAADADKVDDKILVRIRPDYLTVSKGGDVIYEADYWDSIEDRFSGRSRPRRGVFIEKKFAFEIDPSKFKWDYDIPKRIDSEPDFTVTDEGRVLPNPAVLVIAPPIPYQLPK